MRLIDALRLGERPRLVLVGAGGKTTALFQLARELAQGCPTVLVSATTHLAVQQLALADRHFIIRAVEDLHALEQELPRGVVLCIGPEDAEPERMASLTPALLERLRDLADARACPLLLEGDGSRRRPLKAPAAHEPIIPPWADTVVVVAGLAGVGQPLNPPWVHRPELFSALSGLGLGQAVTVEALAAALTHPLGGLKGIPPGARRLALLNQADDPNRQAAAQRLAELLLGAYQGVVAAALAPPQPAQSGALAVYEPIGGVILAAGGSTRLGRPKQILPWRGEALVRHVARAALNAGLSPVVVVTGCAGEEVLAALADLPLIVADNPRWQEGQSSSIKVGLAALPPECGAAAFLLADQPQVSVELLRALIEKHSISLAPIIAPLIDGQRGNPVLFDRRTFADLLALSGDVGGRALFSRYAVEWLPWHDAAQGLDVDTEQDYGRLVGSGELGMG